MKIVFTGGGSGGHVYPLIAIAERFNELLEREKIVQAKLYFFSDTPYDKSALFENRMEYVYIPSGKLRIYFSLKNILSIFQTGFGVLIALLRLYAIYPDVVVGKGGYASFPTLLAARILRIPIIIHESDTVPGRANTRSGKFADRIALSYPEAAAYFPQEKVAVTGQPIRRQIEIPAKDGVFEFYKLDPTVPVILVLGGSQGAEIVNEAVINALPELLKEYQVIHQVGVKNFEASKAMAEIVMGESRNLLLERYRPIGFLNLLGERMASGACSVIISRAGSAIFEIATWHKPSIIIPITQSNGDHQRTNAYSYARSGACIVIEEANLNTSLLVHEVHTILKDEARKAKMIESAKHFVGESDAALTIAQEVLNLALTHEK